MSQNINKKQNKNKNTAKKNDSSKVKNIKIKKNNKSLLSENKPKLVKTKSVPLLSKKHIPKITGKGDYGIKDAYNNIFDKDTQSEGFVNKAAKKIGETVGNTFGFGRELGNAASNLARVFGFGDYSINDPKVINHKYPVKKNSFINNSPPTFSGSKGEDIIITRREYIKDIPAANVFSAQKFFLNPGNPELFPWLSQFAKGYEEYQFLGMVFEFKSTASAAAADGGGLATVCMATDYDCLDENYRDKRAMEASEFANSCKCSYSFLHPIECDPKRNVLGKMFVLPGITNINQINTSGAAPFADPRFDTLGQTYIAVQGGESTIVGSMLGELWVTYKIRLSRPILELGTTNSGLLQTFQMGSTTTGTLTTQPNGKNVTVRTSGGVGFSYVSCSIPTVNSGWLRLNYDSVSTGYFVIMCTGRVPDGLPGGTSSTWAAHTSVNSNTITSPGYPGGTWSYDTNLFFTAQPYPYTLYPDFRVTSFTDTSMGGKFKPYQSVHIGNFSPGTNGVNYIDLPFYVNTGAQSMFQVTIIGIGDPDLTSYSRVRSLMYNNLSKNQENGQVETSYYLPSSKDEIVVDDDPQESDDEETKEDELMFKKVSKEKHHPGCQDLKIKR